MAPGESWPIKTREHVDLWLHGFAMLSVDTTKVPYFRRGYRDELTVQKNGAGNPYPIGPFTISCTGH